MSPTRLTAYWSARLAVCLYILIAAVGAWFDPETRVGELVAATGNFGWFNVMALAMLASLGILDVLVNDFMPARYTLAGVYRRRHLLFMAMAITSATLSGVVAAGYGWAPILLRYWLDALCASVLAFLEMFARHKEELHEQ